MKCLKLVVYALCLSFCACKHQTTDLPAPKNNNPVPQSLTTKQDSLPFEASHYEPFKGTDWDFGAYKDFLTPSLGIFSETALVYAYPDTAAQALDTLKRGEPVIGLELRKGRPFARILYKNSKQGFIQNKDLYLYKESVSKGGSVLIAFGNAEYPFCLKMLLCDKNNRITHTYTDTTFDFTDSGMGIHRVNDNHGVDLFRISTSRAQSCPGLAYESFYVVDKQQIYKLIEASSTGEEGYSDEETVYLPVEVAEDDENPKYVLLKNGTVTVNRKGALEIFDAPIPKNLNFPMKELIVWEEKNEEEEVLKHKKTIFYRWDGQTLQAVKTQEKNY